MSGEHREEEIARARASRLAAVQALYQLDMGTASPEQALDSVRSTGAALDEAGTFAGIDIDLTTAIVRGVAAERTKRLDEMIDGALSAGWSVGRLESLMRVILRAAVLELLERPDVPARVIINEYVDIAHAFFGRGEPGMVNAVLDRLARLLRAGELPPPSAASGG